MRASPASTYSTMYVHAKHLKICILDNFWMIIRFCDTILYCPHLAPNILLLVKGTVRVCLIGEHLIRLLY